MVAVPPEGPLDPVGPDRDSDAVRDVTEPPGCVVAIDVSDEFAALPYDVLKNELLLLNFCQIT